jgi:hypothetical protein
MNCAWLVALGTQSRAQFVGSANFKQLVKLIYLPQKSSDCPWAARHVVKLFFPVISHCTLYCWWINVVTDPQFVYTNKMHISLNSHRELWTSKPVLSTWSTDVHVVVRVNGLRLSLNCDHQRAYCSFPDHYWVLRATVEWYWQGKTEELEEKPFPVPLGPPKILHGLTRGHPSHRGERQATNRLSHGTVLFWVLCPLS